MHRFPARRSCASAARALASLAFLSLLLRPAPPAAGQARDRTALVTALDSVARAHAGHPMVAGVSVAVVRGADTLLMKGYGLADLEWSIPTPPAATASYEIGSVTKQFTAAAILKLVEDGKLDLDEDFTTYLPDFDTKGHRVPLRRLLDHTSGIKGYTEMPVFGEIAGRELPRDSLVSLIEAEPFEFEPGTAQIYNNSAYFLLGLIIEKVTGESYGDWVRQKLFEPAGMNSSYYCSQSAIREGKAHGYDGSPQGLEHRAYLDHTWPFAAGSLCSTAGDMVRWNQALHGGRVLQPASYEAMTTPMPLVDGTAIGYGMGLAISDRAGKRTISHGGGINGYLSDASYFPDDSLVIVVLQNSTGPRNPAMLGAELANLILGPVPPPQPVPYTGDLDALVGEYAGPVRGSHMHMVVSRDGEQLVLTAAGQQNGLRPVHVGDGVWAGGANRVRFVTAAGKALELRLFTPSSHYVLRRVR